MSVYSIADIEKTDGQWIANNTVSMHNIVHRHGGCCLAHSVNLEMLEGRPRGSDLVALIGVPPKDAVNAFAANPRTALFAAAHQHGGNSRVRPIDDTALARTVG